MILEFRCSNIRSINEEIVFSMQAISGLPKEETLITLCNHKRKYLRLAQIFGANGSGKTTLLRGIDSMRSIIVESYKKDYDIKSRYMPHKFNLNEPTTFVMQLIPSQSKDETVYYYTFSYNGECIKEEALYYLKDEEYVTIYERDGQDVTWGDEFTGNYNLNKLTPSMLLLSYVGAVKSEITLIDISQIKEVYNFFKEDIVLGS